MPVIGGERQTADSLIVSVTTGQIASQAFWLLEYDFVLQPAVNASAGAPATVAA